MWKKFLAVMAITGLLSAQTTAFAADPVPGDGPSPYTPLISSATVTPTTFNPGAGETTTLKVTVSQSAYIGVKVYNSVSRTLVSTVVPSVLVQANTEKAISYNGKTGNQALADGQYYFQTVATNVAGTTTEYNTKNFVIVSSTTPTSLTFGSFTLSTSTFNPKTGVLTFNYSLSKTPSEVSVAITTETGSPVITVSNLNPTSKDGTLTWDGTINHGSTVVADGKYKAIFTAKAGTEEVHSPVESFTISTTTTPPTPVLPGVINSTILKNVFATPNPWDPSDDELEIEWELSKDVKDFSLIAKRWNDTMTDYVETIELWEDEDMDQDDYEFDWNGLDEDDEMIKEGNWDLVFKADNDTVHYTPVVVKYAQVAINSDLFVTKTPFDNSIGEFTYVVFRVDQTAKVTVEVMKGNKDIETLMDEEEISKNKWTAVKWDGTDEDGDDVDEGDYKFRITASNPSNEDVETFAYADVSVEEDEVSNKTNATNDFITPVVVDKNANADETNAVVEYTIDDDAEVTVEIFKGTKSSNPEIVLEKNVSKSEGTYVLYWNGRDEDGKKLDKNAKYSYRVTAKTEGSTNKTDKERGFFVIGDSKTMTVEPPVVNPPVVEPVDCGFWDVDTSSEYCEAIAWTKAAGIFEGTPSGAFKPYNFINRVEALKVVLRAFDVPTLPDDYTNLGFADTVVGSWYMKYLRTGKFYGMVNGYAGTKFVEPANEINRVELLKYVLEAAETVGGYDVPVCTAQYYSDTQAGAWYSDYVCLAHDYNLYNTYAGYFYPGSKVMRGEVALLLYRLAQAGLLQ
jgi:flagellar hook assembly protein FlgD